MEAIIPTEIEMPTLRTKVPGMANAEAISKDLDMENELREPTAICIASYQKMTTNLYNKHIKSRAFCSLNEDDMYTNLKRYHQRIII